MTKSKRSRKPQGKYMDLTGSAFHTGTRFIASESNTENEAKDFARALEKRERDERNARVKLQKARNMEDFDDYGDYVVEAPGPKRGVSGPAKPRYMGKRGAEVSDEERTILSDLDGSKYLRMIPLESRCRIYRFWYSSELIQRNAEIMRRASNVGQNPTAARKRRAVASEEEIMQVFLCLHNTLGPRLTKSSAVNLIPTIRQFLNGVDDFVGFMPVSHIVKARKLKLAKQLKRIESGTEGQHKVKGVFKSRDSDRKFEHREHRVPIHRPRAVDLKSDHEVKSDLNGTRGSHTDTDDHDTVLWSGLNAVGLFYNHKLRCNYACEIGGKERGHYFKPLFKIARSILSKTRRCSRRWQRPPLPRHPDRARQYSRLFQTRKRKMKQAQLNDATWVSVKRARPDETWSCSDENVWRDSTDSSEPDFHIPVRAGGGAVAMRHVSSVADQRTSRAVHGAGSSKADRPKTIKPAGVVREKVDIGKPTSARALKRARRKARDEAKMGLTAKTAGKPRQDVRGRPNASTKKKPTLPPAQIRMDKARDAAWAKDLRERLNRLNKPATTDKSRQESLSKRLDKLGAALENAMGGDDEGKGNGGGPPKNARPPDPWDEIRKGYLVSDYPNQVTLTRQPDEPASWYDCQGEPFCGVTAIDTGVLAERSVGKYINVAESFSTPDNVIDDMGDPYMLRRWAAMRGVNLIIRRVDNGREIVRFENAPEFDWVTLGFEAMRDYAVRTGFDAEEFDALEKEHGDWSGHYLLGLGPCSRNHEETNLITHRLDAPIWGPSPSTGKLAFQLGMAAIAIKYSAVVVTMALGIAMAPVFLGLAALGLCSFSSIIPTVAAISTATGVVALVKGLACFAALKALFYILVRPFVTVHRILEFGAHHRSVNDNDTREIISRRDALEHQEVYVEASENFDVVVSIPGTELTRFRLPVRMCWSTREHDYIILAQRYKSVTKEMQHLHSIGLDPSKALNTLSMHRGVNHDSNRPHDFVNTARACKIFAETLGNQTNQQIDTTNLVQYNHPGRAAMMPDPVEVGARQIINVRGGGLGNAVSKSKWRRADPKKVVVAKSPLGAVIAADGVVSAGCISITDSDTLLAGFITRGMCKSDEINQAAVARCVSRAGRFFDHIVKNTPVPDLAQDTNFVDANIACFRKVYKGKRSQEFIESKVESYLRYTRGVMKPSEYKKYTQNSCFIKFESNMKQVGEHEYRSRPRVIMTMSDLMMMELIQLVPAIHALYAGPLSKYQVKGYSLDDMSSVVEQFALNGAMVTDASAFESSLKYELTQIERSVFIAIMEKCGLTETIDAFVRHYKMDEEDYRRVLVTKFGDFLLGTRASGDFTTSCGNGIMNISFALTCLIDHLQDEEELVCKRWFAVNENGKGIVPSGLTIAEQDMSTKLHIIAEGDDGLVVGETRKAVTAERMATIGIKFSSEVSGTRGGDVDFLRTLWCDGKRYLNIGRCMSIFWVKKGHNLRRGKQLWLMRQSALSLHHRSPNHPVLAAVVWRIAQDTKHVQPFKGWERYLDSWRERPNGPFPATYEVDEDMRQRVEMGAPDFPSVSICNQLTLEKRILNDRNIYIGRILDEYEDIHQRIWATTHKLLLDNGPFEECLFHMQLKEKDIRKLPTLPDADTLLIG